MIVTDKSQISALPDGNKVLGNINLENTILDFRGKNNILYCNGITFKDSYFRFGGDNSVVFFDQNHRTLTVETRTGFDSVIYFGKDNYINQKIYIYATEQKNIIIGNGCLFSFNVYLYTSDPHLIYDFSHKRINKGKSILVGDHVWIGQNSLVLKGAEIGSGSVIGGNSVVSSGVKGSNCIYAGNPCRRIKKDIYFSDLAANNFDAQRAARFDTDKKGWHKEYIFTKDSDTLNFKKIDNILSLAPDAQSRLEAIKSILAEPASKNRFFAR